MLSRPRFRRILWFTVWQAAASAGLAVLFGLPGAYLLYRCRFRGRQLLRALVTVPFVLPTVVVGLAFRSLTADGGPLGAWGLDGSVVTILLAHLFLNYAVVVRTVGATWASLDRRPEDAARSLGRRPAARSSGRSPLPALGPSIAAAAVLVFLFCATSFGIVQILGNAQFSTLETEIYRQTRDVLDLRTAAVLSVLQIVLVTAVLVIAGRIRRRTETTQKFRAAVDAQRPLRPADLPAVVVTAAVGVLLAAPVVTLLVRSLQTPTGWGFGNYAALAGSGNGRLFLVTGWQALGNSLRAAALATLLAVAVGVLLSVVLARKPRERLPRRLIALMDATFMLPLGVSAVTVGFGFLIALDAPPLDLRNSPWLVPIAQALVATPLVVRLILPALRGADDRLRQAAAVLGASPARVWSSVDLPIMAPRAGRRGGVRVRRRARRVRRHQLPGPARRRHPAGRHRPADRPARRRQRRDGLRRRGGARGALRGLRARRRPARQPRRRRGRGGLRMSALPVGGRRDRPVRRGDRRRRRRPWTSATTRRSRCSARPAAASRPCCGRSPASSR